MKIEIDDEVYEKYSQLVKERGFTGEACEYIQDLVEQDLKRACVAGYDRDDRTKAKLRAGLEAAVNDEVLGSGWNDESKLETSYLCLDIHRFAEFVLAHGPIPGHNVLREISEQLLLKYGYENVYRVGGDEFVVRLEDRDFETLSLPVGISLKHSIVKISLQRNYQWSKYLTQMVIFQLDKAVYDARMGGRTVIWNFSI